MSLPNYLLNLEEMSSVLKQMNLSLGLAELDLTKLEELLKENLEAIRELLKLLTGKNNVCYKDMSMHIPAVVFSYEKEFTFEKDSLLTGVTFSQSGWKVTDRITLLLGDAVLLDGIHTKELGEKKDFLFGVYAKEGTKLRIHYHNISGASKMFFCDITYIEMRRGEDPAGKER